MRLDLSSSDQRAERVAAVRASTTVNGIEYVEVAGANQQTINVFFIHPLPGQSHGVPSPPAPALRADNVRIEGGVRVRDVTVVDEPTASGNLLRLRVDHAGDFSVYTLRLFASRWSDDPPVGFDPVLSSVPVYFRLGSTTDLDRPSERKAALVSGAQPTLDYLAKDYGSIRRLLIDRLAQLMPAWTERNPADLQMTLIELLAYSADQLSYFQDAVATEAYLGTARTRTSLRRHARLIDYHVHDGCNARTWVHIAVVSGGDLDGKTLPARTVVLTRPTTGAVDLPAALTFEQGDQSIEAGATVFETCHAQSMHAAHNQIEFHTWSGAVKRLSGDATAATLKNDPPLALRPGDALLLEETCSPATGASADADRAKRFVVRLTTVEATQDPLDGTPVLDVTWHAQDALPAELCLVSEVLIDGVPHLRPMSRARGNLVLADHGHTSPAQPLLLARNDDEPRDEDAGNDDGGAREVTRPVLKDRGLTIAVPYDHALARSQPASSMVRQDVRTALPAVRLNDADGEWWPRRDLLASDRFAGDFVVELEHDGSAFLRFGDDIHGKRPQRVGALKAVYRTGNGPDGNVGADTLCSVVSSYRGVSMVRNPLPADGGTAPESAEEVRRHAPRAFRVQERAVTADDYARVAEGHPEVQRAHASFRWTGSWSTVFVTVDRRGGRPVNGDAAFSRELLDRLDRYRTAGYDIELQDPVFVAIDCVLQVHLTPGSFAADVKGHLAEVFGAHDLRGTRGFFHPDNFSFGQPLYLSDVYAHAMSVPGVASVRAVRLQRWGAAPADELRAGRIVPGDTEILRADSDPSLPENGRIEFEVFES